MRAVEGFGRTLAVERENKKKPSSAFEQREANWKEWGQQRGEERGKGELRGRKRRNRAWKVLGWGRYDEIKTKI